MGQREYTPIFRRLKRREVAAFLLPQLISAMPLSCPRRATPAQFNPLHTGRIVRLK
jgi:hypothetical protein